MTVFFIAIGAAMLGGTAAVFILSACRLAADEDQRREEANRIERLVKR